MYRQGIPSPKIAAVAGAAASTVRFHLQRAVQEDAGLRADHKAARVTITRETSAAQRNLDDVITFHRAEGRLPTTGGKTPRERALGVWLHRRRQDAAADTLSPAYREALRAIPGWDVATSQKADNEARWARRLTELVKYLAAGNDWPRHKGFTTEEERVLGVWLHVQRISRREGKLTPDREARLVSVVPGWRAGRGKPRRARGRHLWRVKRHSPAAGPSP
jgi:Helicase associated domain